MEHLEADVCVVGAGFAGLAAARALRAAHRTVVVLEARDVVGGRVKGKKFGDGTPISVGGTWLGKNQVRMFDLVKHVGLGVYPQYEGPDADHPADVVLRLDGQNSRYQGLAPGIGLWGLASLGAALVQLNEMAATLHPERPWEAPDARTLDAQTLGEWISSEWNVPDPKARQMLRSMVMLLFSTDPAAVSLLGSLVLACGGGDDGFSYYADPTITETHLITEGGAPELARRLGEQLGGALRTFAPVRRILHTDDHVEVVADAVTVRAGYVIVTAPPVLAAQIEYDPPLPDAYGQLMRQMPQGAIMRVVTEYATPFWRDKGLTGQSVAPQSPVPVTIDQSPPTTDDDPRPLGILSSYAVGPHAVEMAAMDPARRREVWLAEIASRLGDQAADPLDYAEMDWSAEQWSQGGMIAHFPPGVLTSYGHVLHQPHGRIYWAGTERATLMHGLMEGAVRSGEQAAGTIAEKLRGQKPALA
jgi:monoamine oxidase